ncbi:MAG: cytochrome b N-terminal domain-containing protein [Pseudomonadales bacterium]
MIRAFERLTRQGWLRLDRGLDRLFTEPYNPLYQLGALSFLYFWIVAVSGVYLFVFFDTSVTKAYVSVEYLTREQWYAGGVMRSLHRYASAAMGVTVTLHLLREFSMGRFRGARAFSWISGVPLLWLLFASAIGGYILVWDQLAQYLATATAEWLDWLPVFGEPIARAFVSDATMSDRLFSLLVFLHIAIPLFLLVGMFIHIKRLKLPRTSAGRVVSAATCAAITLVALVHPATSMAPADLQTVPALVQFDWVYLNQYPLLDRYGPGTLWSIVGAVTLLLIVLPRLSPARSEQFAPAVVDPDNCNGCTWCFQDCPFEAIVMVPHDYKKGMRQAQVNGDLCTGCGICAGACPSATPFRHVDELVSGIEIPDYPLQRLRDEASQALSRLDGGEGIMVFGCDHGADVTRLADGQVATLRLPCTAILPPSFVDYVARQPQVAGILVTGCHPEACYYRLGSEWVSQRLAAERSPHLRTSDGRSKVEQVWAGPLEGQKLEDALAALSIRSHDIRPDGEGGHNASEIASARSGEVS